MRICRDPCPAPFTYFVCQKEYFHPFSLIGFTSIQVYLAFLQSEINKYCSLETLFLIFTSVKLAYSACSYIGIVTPLNYSDILLKQH